MNNVSFINNTTGDIKEIKELGKLIDFALLFEGTNNVIFTVIFVNSKEIHRLNRQWRGIDNTTDVLTFAFEDTLTIKNNEARMLGEIYISLDQARQQAIEYGHTLLRELSFLLIHGFLHLLGYNHEQVVDEKKMFNRQEAILNGYGISK